MSLAPSLSFRTTVDKEDIEVVRSIIQGSGYFLPHEVDVAVELVEENLVKGEEKSGYYFLFAEQDGEPVGYTCYGPIACTIGSFDLFWIAVKDNVRGSGIGRALLKETEHKVRAMQGRAIYIETSSKPLYESTQHFYLKTGYTESARLKDFYAVGDSKIIYEKVL